MTEFNYTAYYLVEAQFRSTSLALEVKRNIERATSNWGRLRSEAVVLPRIIGQVGEIKPLVY